MNKSTAVNLVANANMSSYDVAHSIYLATVEGISGANQNDGYGFALSAIAELWNIRGSVGNPSGRTKLTSRYKGMGITENMILNAVSQYPKGISGNSPLFDDLLGVGNGMKTSGYNRAVNTTNREVSNEDSAAGMGFIVAFVICKFVLHLGWIMSIVLGFVFAGLFMYWASRR